MTLRGEQESDHAGQWDAMARILDYILSVTESQEATKPF